VTDLAVMRTWIMACGARWGTCTCSSAGWTAEDLAREHEVMSTQTIATRRLRTVCRGCARLRDMQEMIPQPRRARRCTYCVERQQVRTLSVLEVARARRREAA